MISQSTLPHVGPAMRARRDFRQSPLLVFYEVTQACDLVCRHCRACAQTRPHAAELSTADSRRLIEQIAEFPAPPMLVLTGGDPLKRADVFQLIEHAVGLGLVVSITPSATPLVTREAIGALRNAGASRLAISIDGVDAATHDAVRGVAGAFDRSQQILADAREVGIPVQVNTTLTPGNVGQIAGMAQMLAASEVVMWSVFFLVPVGRANESVRLSSQQCEAAFAALWRESGRRRYAIKTTEAPHYRRFVAQRSKLGGDRSRGGASRRFTTARVNDGNGVMFVSHAGVIHPSGFLPVVCGMFPFQHVVDVYQRSTVFRALRDVDRLEGKCGVCEYRLLCGGSRARAFAVSGNPFAPEPDCAYIPPGFAEGDHFTAPRVGLTTQGD